MQPGRRATVVVADRHDFVRRVLAGLIDAEPGFAVVADAPDAAAAETALRRRRPHLLLVEPAVLGEGGLVQLPRLLRCSPATRAVVLADELSDALEHHATGHGAVAAIVKHAAPEELFAALHRALTLPARIVPAQAEEF